ncbi:MAG: glycerol-3-phosphate dehydrogenase [Bermanella sp.]|jgi:glycerol-3-phosphate dehydrogenase
MKLRESNIQHLKDEVFDVLVIGGGINGAVTAAALSTRGVRVAMIDRGDFAGGTSQESSNLAWGGIKYMESGEYRLVRSLCKSRNQLMREYPSTVQEIRFLTTIARGFRWHPVVLWMGTWLYWFIGMGQTARPRILSRRAIAAEAPMVDTREAVGGFEYSDAFLYDNDARFVFDFVRSALSNGCIAANYVESQGAECVNGVWQVKAHNMIGGDDFTMQAKVLVNAAGAWLDGHNQTANLATEYRHLLSKGIHLIVDQIGDVQRVLTFFADDGRLFFAIPMGTRTCVGTTDTRVDSLEVHVTNEDQQFVLDNINRRLRLAKPLTAADVISRRCGVRPLAIKGEVADEIDFLQLSRKHIIEIDKERPHLSIFGGKLTDCINVGEEVCELIEGFGIKLPFPNRKWYGEPSASVREEFEHQARLMNLDAMTAPESSEPLTCRLWRRYGAQAIGLLENIREDKSQAEVLIKGTEYTRCELRQASRREMIVKLEDFLRRRSKIALVERKEVIREAPGLMEACEILFGADAQQRFDEYFSAEK